MKLVLVALNARYTHTNLAIRCLRAALWQRVSASSCEVICREYTIQESVENIVGDIYRCRPDVVGFSCYIWNISQMTAVIRRLRLVNSEACFICGGPEVSFGAEEFLAANPEVDWVVSGEGEGVLAEFVSCHLQGDIPRLRSGLTRQRVMCDCKKPVGSTKSVESDKREEGLVGFAADRGRVSGDACSWTASSWWVDPYPVEEDFSNRYVYLEASRGCPFQCSYCLSAGEAGVRYMDVERLADVFGRLFQWGARRVKLVDRTFNAHPQGMRVLDIFRNEWEKYQDCVGLRDSSSGDPGKRDTGVRIHCEMAGDLLSGDWLEFLAAYPRGMIQLEIGVQSVHQNTLAALRRRQDFDGWAARAGYLQHECGIPIHIDLIVGLPGEDKTAVLASVDRVMGLRPGRLQLGFLKMLKGAPLTEEGDRYGIVASPDPPYEVLRTGTMSYEDLLELHRIEDMLEKYYNAGFLGFGLETMVRELGSFSELFSCLAGFWLERGWFGRQWSRRDLLNTLHPFLLKVLTDEAAWARCVEALRFDYYLAGNSAQNLPEWLAGLAEEADEDAYPQRDKEIWRRCLPVGQTLDKRQWARRTSVSCFRFDMLREFLIGKGPPETGVSGAGVFWCLFLARAGEEVEVFGWED